MFDARLSVQRSQGPGYVCLHPDNLQDPDLYIVDGDQIKALVTLAYLRPTDVRPALLIGKPHVELPYPSLERPLDWPALFRSLDALIEKRADALSRLEAATLVAVPERRRKTRLDLDLTDPAEYARMRTSPPQEKAVLMVDRNAAARDWLAGILGNRQSGIVIDRSADEAGALEACRKRAYSAVLVNTSAKEIDPYRLCWAIKEKAVTKTAVVLLLGPGMEYDGSKAAQVGADGFLVKPVAAHHMLHVLKKFIPALR